MRQITIIQGHPDPAGNRLLHGLADAYAEAAASAGHSVRRIEVAKLDFALLRTKDDFEQGAVPERLVVAQEAILWAEHLVFFYPLWLGAMPALLKGFLEQTLRPGFAFDYGKGGKITMHLKGRSARVVVTMGMPALAYRWYFLAHSLKSFKRNILKFSGIKPVRTNLFGMVEKASEKRRRQWFETLRRCGRQGD